MAMADFGMLGIAGVIAAWVVFAVMFVLRRWSMPRVSQARQPIAWLGIALQATAFACIWGAPACPRLCRSSEESGRKVAAALNLGGNCSQQRRREWYEYLVSS